MRRALRAVLLIGLGLALVAAGTGVAVMRGHERALRASAPVPSLSGAPLGVLHLVTAHATAVALSLAAAMGFLLGLQGLLEPRSPRRLASALLLLLAPVLMAGALASEMSGYMQWEDGVGGAPLQASFASYVAIHGVRLPLIVLAALAVGLGLAAWAAPLHGNEDQAAG